MRAAPFVLLVALAGCRVESPTEAPDADPLAVAPVAPPPGTPPGGCTLVARDSVTLYTRPSAASARFGTLAPGDSATAAGRAPGFVGIAPGTAQAANVGPFRLRYTPADGPFALVGDCAALPPQPLLDPTACYAAAAADAPLHARPDAASSVVATLPAGGFAVATQRVAPGWLRVTLGSGVPGWIASEDVDQSGPDCEAL